MKTAVLIVAGLTAVFSFIPFVRQNEWWIRVFDFPRMQIFIVGLITLSAWFILWDVQTWAGGTVLAILVLGLLVQAHRILPYTPLFPKEVVDTRQADAQTGEPSIALLVANVLMSNRGAERFIRLIEEWNPDIVLALEPDDWWEEQLRVLEDRYTFAVKEPRDNRYGMLLYSRFELIEPEVKYLISDRIPSMHARVRLPSGDTIWLHCLHPEPPSPTEADESTPRDAELLVVGREVRDRKLPTIVTGDLNDVAWSHTTTLFQKISRLLDPRKGRGMFNTFHARYPFMRWPLDHVFHSDHFTFAEMARLPEFGSDHFPVYVRLVLQPGAPALQDTTEADDEDREQAAEAVEDARDGMELSVLCFAERKPAAAGVGALRRGTRYRHG
jgi:endonuclease/exonuclease/phosphatase (EEP) superfamily protein YafD